MREWSAKNRECARELTRQSYQRNKDKRAAYYKEWAAQNKEKIRQYQKQWNEDNADAMRQKKREWRSANREKVNFLKKARYANNPEVKEQVSKWFAAHPEVKKAAKHNRRAKERTAAGKFTGQEFIDLCAMYGNKCLCCGSSDKLTADHVVPLSKGGTNFIENIQPLCLPCNKHKGTRVIDYRPDYEFEVAA